MSIIIMNSIPDISFKIESFVSVDIIQNINEYLQAYQEEKP